MALTPLVICLIFITLVAAIGLTVALGMARPAGMRRISLLLGALVCLLSAGTLALFTGDSAITVSFSSTAVLAGVIGLVMAVWGSKWSTWLHPGQERFYLMTFACGMCWGMCGFNLVFGLRGQEANAFLPALLPAWLVMLFPALYRLTDHLWKNIPELRYRRWYYDSDRALPILEPVNVIPVNIMFTKLPDERVPTFEGYEVELPGDIELGILYQYIIYSHNNRHQQHRKNPIAFTANGKPLGWVIYKDEPEQGRIYLDSGKSLRENRIRRHDKIIAQSYSE